MQVKAARSGRVTDEMLRVSHSEGVDVESILQGVAAGEVVILHNNSRGDSTSVGIGKGLRTKVNANIGASEQRSSIVEEVNKARVAVDAGADALMDLSTGQNIREIRLAILNNAKVPLGTVPLYQAAVEAREQRGSIVDMQVGNLFSVIEEQMREGVDFMTLHCGVTRRALECLQRSKRRAGIVSRGGALMVGWMLHNDAENPLYEHYDRLLGMAARHDITISLGDALRPGCIDDGTDQAQIQELLILGDLVTRAREAGVQVMVEGPGHVPIEQVQSNVLLEKQICKGAPFYVLGPLVTDVAPGYDHIVGAIGGALAAAAGTDFLCYVTPAEHLGLPDADDVREGVIASRIAAHVGDLVKSRQIASNWDRDMASARLRMDWQAQLDLAIDPTRANRYRSSRTGDQPGPCSMCGSLCAIELVKEFLEGDLGDCG